MKTKISLCALGLAIVSLGACNGVNGLGGLGGFGGNLGAVVAAFLPEGVSLDVSELPNDPNAGAKSKGDAELPNLTPYQRTLRAAARVVFNFHRLADQALALGARIRNDMTSADQTQVSGNLNINGVAVPYKADFAAFDFDGDGAADGSGNAVDTPVALRMWVDRGNGYEQFLCALITTKPSSSNLGAGQMFVRPGAARADAPADMQAFVNWDRTDSAHKWNEAYLSGQLGDGMRLTDGHHRVDVRIAGDSSLEKTVRSSVNFSENPYGLQEHKASVHFKPGSGYALLSGEASGTGGTFSFTDVCVDLAAQGLATGGECSAFDTQDNAFIDAPVGGETNFPAGFPATPTF